MSRRYRPARLFVLAFALIGMLSACSQGTYRSHQYGEPTADPYTLQKSQLTNASQTLREAETLYSEAMRNDLGTFAPQQMRHAQWYLVRAQDAYQKMRRGMMYSSSRFQAYRANGYADKVYEMSGKTIDLLREAKGIKQRVDLILTDAMDGRKRLIEIGAPQTYPKEFRKVEGDLGRLISHIAANREQKAIIYEPRLLDTMRGLEIKTLDKRYLSQADQLIDSLERSGVARWAPQTYRAAEASLENARAFLHTNPQDDETLVKMAEEVSRHAHHARNIASEVQKLKRRHTETAVLELEAHLARIGKGLNVEDLRHMPLREQAKILAERGAALSGDIEGLREQNEALTARNQQLEQDLTAHRRSQSAVPAVPAVPQPAEASPRPLAPYPLPEFKLRRDQPAPVVRTQRVIPLDPE